MGASLPCSGIKMRYYFFGFRSLQVGLLSAGSLAAASAAKVTPNLPLVSFTDALISVLNFDSVFVHWQGFLFDWNDPQTQPVPIPITGRYDYSELYGFLLIAR